MLRKHGGPVAVLTVLMLASWMSLVGQGIIGGGGGGSGSGTITNGAANDIPCYSDTNEVGPCQTGALTHPADNTLQFNDVTITFANGVFTIQDATPTTGVTQLIVKAGAGQGGTPMQEWQNSSGGVIASTRGSTWTYSGGTIGVQFVNSGTTFAYLYNGTGSITKTSGSYDFVYLQQTFAPTSGTATYTDLVSAATINQTGGANGITRGLYVNPNLTAAADWRSIDLANVTNSHFAINTGTGKVSFGGPVNLKSNTTTFSATPEFDGGAGNIIHIELEGEVTSSTIINLVDGRLYTFRICTDGTGSYTFAWPTNVKGAMTVGTDPDSCSVQDFVSDGTNLWARSLGVINQPE